MAPAQEQPEQQARAYDGLLADPGPGIGRALLPSLLLHLPLALLLIGAIGKNDRRPLLDRDHYMVSAIVLPKAKDLPDKAAAPRPKAPPAPKTPDPKPTSPEPTPVPNELVLAQKKDRKEPKEKPEKAQPAEPRDHTNTRADLLASLNTEEADEARFATDVDGDPDAVKELGLKAQFGRQLTAYEREVRDAIQYNWFPKYQGAQDPDLWAAISFEIDENGSILAPQIEKGSGDMVFDQSCLRAVIRTRRVNPPPKDAARLISVGFSPQDKP